jgi:ADP-heptose:LPS heptosyltransferase
MKHILFINTQAFGDVLLGINAARRYKEEHPEDTVSFCLRDNL